MKKKEKHSKAKRKDGFHYGGYSFLFIRDKYTLYYGKEVLQMITFTVLLLTILALAIIGAVATGVVGVATLLAFGDVIVCVMLVGIILKYLFKKLKK